MSLLKDLGYEMKAVAVIDAKAPEQILHRQGICRLKHTDVAHLWLHDEIRSRRLRVHRVKSEENVADPGTKPLCRAEIAKHCFAPGYVNMAEDSAWCKMEDVAMFWDSGAMQKRKDPSVRDGRQDGQLAVSWAPRRALLTAAENWTAALILRSSGIGTHPSSAESAEACCELLGVEEGTERHGARGGSKAGTKQVSIRCHTSNCRL